MDINLVVPLFAGALLVFSAFSTFLERVSLPGPLLSLAFGALIGPQALGWVRIEVIGLPTDMLLEGASRFTLAIGLAGVALRLPHGYWRTNARWLAVAIGLGMGLMLVIATGLLWWGLGLPFLVALLVGAIITPTDPVVTTPIVTGSLAEKRIPERVRHNLSAESGINDGLAFLFVMVPVLLMTAPGRVWSELLIQVLIWEVLVGTAVGVLTGYVLGKLFNFARARRLMEESSYLAFILPLAMLLLGVGMLTGTDALLVVFVGVAVFGQVIPQREEAEEDRIHDATARLFLLPVFILIGLSLPIDEWVQLGWTVPLAVTGAVLLRRVLTLWALRPLLRRVYDRSENAFVSWFGPVGVSALFYATLAERHTGIHEIFVYTTLAITISVIIHGLSSAPFSVWLMRRERQAL